MWTLTSMFKDLFPFYLLSSSLFCMTIMCSGKLYVNLVNNKLTGSRLRNWLTTNLTRSNLFPNFGKTLQNSMLDNWRIWRENFNLKVIHFSPYASSFSLALLHGVDFLHIITITISCFLILNVLIYRWCSLWSIVSWDDLDKWKMDFTFDLICTYVSEYMVAYSVGLPSTTIKLGIYNW